jgi:hypothetical protein
VPIRFYEDLIFKIKERRSVYSDRLLSGTFDTLDEYKLIVGKLKGLDEAEQAAQLIYRSRFESHKDSGVYDGELESG